MKSLKLFVILVLIPWLSVLADEGGGETFQPERYFRTFFNHAKSLASGPLTEKLDSFQVVVEDSVAGSTSGYSLQFKLSRKAFCSLCRGGISFSFPTGFDLSPISMVGIIDDCPAIDYGVRHYEISGEILTLFLTKRHHHDGSRSDDEDCEDDEDEDDDDDQGCTRSVRMVVNLRVVGNPIQAGRYVLVGLAFNRKNAVIAGPSFSREFGIVPGPLYAIGVSPGLDTTLRAGDVISFSAVGVDRFGNAIPGLVFDWLLAEGSDEIGQFSGSVFQALTVGQGWAVASAEGVEGRSGLITVIPGDLARMVLDVSSDQVVGQPLLRPAQITLYDNYENLKSDYDLSAKPISLVSSEGSLEPDIVDNQELLSEGVVNLLPAGMTYVGPSAVVDIVATNGGATSSAVEVSFNGYDILAVLDSDGATVSQVFAGVENAVSVVVQNNGTLRPMYSPSVGTSFKVSGGLSQTSFAPNSNGVVDTIAVVLPVIRESLTEDTLVIELNADYEIEGQIYTTTDRWQLPVSIVLPPRFEVVENSFQPDTVYPGEPFNISFEVSAEGFQGPIDGTDLVVELSPSPDDSGKLLIYDGSPAFDSFQDGIISYRGLAAVVNPQAGLQPGWYAVTLDYSLISGSARFGLTDTFPDSIFLLPELQASYVDNSLGPVTVYTGSETAFHFDIALGNDFPIRILHGNARFTIYGSDFSVSTNLIFSGGSLLPGDNNFETEKIFIPMSQLGERLRVSAVLSLVVPGVGSVVRFKTDFGNQTVLVEQRPVAQIIEVEALAPNSPKVNILQPFQIRCRVANLSSFPLGPLELGLSSDGNSVYDSTLTVLNIDPSDTVEVYFDVTASLQPNADEVFKVDILSPDVNQLPPVDNTASVTIEIPAKLKLAYSLMGVENGLVGQDENFTLTVELQNLGEAAVSDGTYILTTGGVIFDTEDTITGVISSDRLINFYFRAPLFDTTVTFVFSLVGIPLDLNTNKPVSMEDTSFEFSVRVESLQADLLVTPAIIGSNLVLPGRQKSFYRFDLTNRGGASVASIRLDEVTFEFKQGNGAFLDVGSILDPIVSGFYEDGLPVSHTSLKGDKLVLSLDNFVVAATQTRSIVLKGRFKEGVPPSFTLSLKRDDIQAFFTEGPGAGRRAKISSPVEGEYLLYKVYATKGKELQESFVIENNPFHPDIAPARFSYELVQPSEVEFRIFTLTGEEVYARDLPRGSAGATPGENEIIWDGRNNAGRLVLNGVYIASLKIIQTGEYARMKVAVVK